jgi:thiamine-monophosphate kinase
MTRTLADIGENALLEYFAAMFPPAGALFVGPGDDCAVTSGHADDVLLKTDALVEGVHFLAGESARRVGHKAVARVFSDIAAMGGTPMHLLVTLALPASTTVDWLEGFYHGARSLCDTHLCRIAGGELSGMPHTAPMVISIAATGRIARGQAVLRSGGQDGDVLAVTGRLGGSFASGHHLDFLPRLAEGQWLARHHGVHAMMDLSDGLAKDLPRLARASGCAFRLDAAALPCRPGCSAREAIGDGEDYELLVAIHPSAWREIQSSWKQDFPTVPLTAIGNLITSPLAAPADLAGGWDHFR